MKRLSAGLILLFALLFAPSLFAQSCWGVCQAYYPCSYYCELCVGDPGLWDMDGRCWGEIQPATCGDIGQCSGGYLQADLPQSDDVPGEPALPSDALQAVGSESSGINFPQCTSESARS